MAGKLSQASVQVLVRLLTADRRLLTGSRLEVEHRYSDRESGARSGWTLVLVDLVTGAELEVGSDVAFDVLLQRRPWSYRTTSAGLEVRPAGRPGAPAVARAAAETQVAERQVDERPVRVRGGAAARLRPRAGVAHA